MAKNFIFSSLLLGICCDVYGWSRASSPVTAQLADVILKSSYSMVNDPASTAKCFQEYSPKLIHLNEQYEQSYNDCLNHTAEEEDTLAHQLQNDIDGIQNSVKIMGLHFYNCSALTNSLHDLFECYYNAAGFIMQSASEARSLSRNKMEYVQISEQYISYNQTVCTEECFQVYNENSIKINSDLENCLAGFNAAVTTTTAKPDVSVVPTKAPETSQEPATTKTSETTVEEIETSSVETTTKAPAKSF